MGKNENVGPFYSTLSFRHSWPFFSRFRFKDGLRRFCGQVCFPEVPLLGTSGPFQAPSTYVADLGLHTWVCVYAQFPPAPNPVFLAPLGETSVTDRFFRFKAILPSVVACLILLSWALMTPLNQYGKAQSGRFIHVKGFIHSFSPGPRGLTN